MKKQREKKSKDLSLPLEGFCRPEQFAHALGISESLLWAWVKDGKLPKPQKIEGARITRWPVGTARKTILAQGGSVLPVCQDSPPTPAS